MKKFLKYICVITFGFLPLAAHAGQMVNVEYIHRLIAREWGVNVPYNPALENPRVAAHMKYLLTAIDRANEILNEAPTTDYGNSEYATLYAADTNATNKAVAQLIKKGKDYTFAVITTPDTSSFSFTMSAAGNFTVDWGDGNIREIVRTDTNEETYSHTYATAKKYKIGFEGKATGYNAGLDPKAAISFDQNKNIEGIRGSLGAIFGTIGNGGPYTGNQPGFSMAFYKCTNLTGAIPPNLFAGLTGHPSNRMFDGTFSDCAFTGSIPESLFGGLSGTATRFIFHSTFANCNGLTGSIPKNLFAGIKGTAPFMFMHTFAGCYGLSGPIPDNMFGGTSGTPASNMFYGTFSGCVELTGIPTNLFGNISGDAATDMFTKMFSGCGKLTGNSAKINEQYLYEIWDTGGTSCYTGATGLSDYADIPAAWGGGGN